MRKIFLLTLLLAAVGSMNAQNNVVFQSAGGNANTTAADNRQYYINGISTQEDVGGVEMSRGAYRGYGHEYYLKFTNYNNFMASVIYEFEDIERGQVTGNIVLKPGETKQSSDSYKSPVNFKVITRQMNTGYQPQTMAYAAAPAVTAGIGAGRIGFVCAGELIPQLPEYASACARVERFTQTKQASYDNLVKEFNLKYEAYQTGHESWPEAERRQKEQELADLQKKVSELSESISQELNRYQADQMAPLLSKVTNAVDAVGRANGYDVIVDVSSSGNVLYKGKAFYELNELVRKELGISR